MRMVIRTILLALLTCGFFTQCNSQKRTNEPLEKPGDSAYTYHVASQDGIGKFYKGREIAHVMGAAGSDWLERPDRNQEENTKLAIEKIDVPQTATIADIGAGTGYYSFRLAAKVPKGKVYAVEIQQELIDLLEQKKAALKDSVVEIVRGTIKEPGLAENSVDLAIMVDVYHELEFPQEMLQALKIALKPGGKILLIEYRGEDASVPIKALHKTSVAQLEKEFSANGYRLASRGDFLPIQHFLLFEKKLER